MYQLAAKGINGKRSGLHIVSLLRYGTADVLERGDNGIAAYVHRVACPKDCGRKCNGERGGIIAADIADVELARPKLARRHRRWKPRRSWLVFNRRRESGVKELNYEWTEEIRPEAVTKSWGYVYWENDGSRYCAHG